MANGLEKIDKAIEAVEDLCDHCSICSPDCPVDISRRALRGMRYDWESYLQQQEAN